MTEEEWLNCRNVRLMISTARRRRGTRKWRLFALACCRGIEDLLSDQGKKVLEVTERFIERQATDRMRAQALEEVAHSRQTAADCAVRQASLPTSQIISSALDVSYWATRARGEGYDLGPWQEAAEMEELQLQADLLRDIFGNPFRPEAFSPEQWVRVAREQDGLALRLAQAIYEERAFDRLPILADALEDAGCVDEQILGHCRGPGAHARGCWVVDAVLGKK